MDIETVAEETPEKIINIDIDPLTGMRPFHASQIAFALGLEGAQDWPTGDAKAMLSALEPGRSFEPADILFAKIEDDQVAEWSERFGGAS